MRKRGFFGWIFLLIFLAFNLFMIVWLATYWGSIGGMLKQGSSAEQTGAAIGATVGTSFIVFFWAAGAAISGLFVLLSRGKKYYVEDVSDIRVEPERREPRP